MPKWDWLNRSENVTIEVMRRLAATMLALCVFAGCATQPKTSIVTKLPGDLSSAEEDIIELLIREKESVPWQKGDFRVGVIFLTIERQDPTASLISRLNRIRPVLPATAGQGSTQGAFDRETGERGEGVRYYNIVWKSIKNVELDFDHFVAGLSGNFGKCEVIFENGSWRIVKWQILGVS